MLPEGEPSTASKGNGDCTNPKQAIETLCQLAVAPKTSPVLDFEGVGHGLVAGFYAQFEVCTVYWLTFGVGAVTGSVLEGLSPTQGGGTQCLMCWRLMMDLG